MIFANVWWRWLSIKDKKKERQSSKLEVEGSTPPGAFSRLAKWQLTGNHTQCSEDRNYALLVFFVAYEYKLLQVCLHKSYSHIIFIDIEAELKNTDRSTGIICLSTQTSSLGTVILHLFGIFLLCLAKNLPSYRKQSTKLRFINFRVPCMYRQLHKCTGGNLHKVSRTLEQIGEQYNWNFTYEIVIQMCMWES